MFCGEWKADTVFGVISPDGCDCGQEDLEPGGSALLYVIDSESGTPGFYIGIQIQVSSMEVSITD